MANEYEEQLMALVGRIDEPDHEAMAAAEKRQEFLAKVPGSLGRLEDISVKIAGITGKVKDNDLKKQCIAIFSSDNGVVQEGVASAPQSVTFSQTINFPRRITGMSSQAKYFGIDVLDVNVGVKMDIPEALCTKDMVTEDGRIARKIVDRRLAAGTKNFVKEGESMTREEAAHAMLIGFEAADAMKKAGIELAGVGEMGIGNTTTGSIMIGAITGVSADQLVGRGGGLDDEGLAIKRKVVGDAVERVKDMDTLGKLSAAGGFDIAAMAGCYLGCAKNHMPVVIDGFISISAAVVAYEVNPMVAEYMFASHKSTEIGYVAAIEKLGLKPMFDLGMRLGEGSGCPIAFKVIEAAEGSMSLMLTLEEADINGGYLEHIKEGHFLDDLDD
ncbi:MAG: nicotinate-nucleotide--dimethylbenzimidazole phosphoribosyltransferase [Eubacteriales bacterium]|nr:nicotinate-nucleotide--dimethylbenzimidazole phosphoribosyltransferase [Eubacteriales bacterium]